MRIAALLVALAFTGAAFAADEDKDLDMIPGRSGSTSAPDHPARDEGRDDRGTTLTNSRIFLENALTFNSLRNDLLVPFPPPLPPRWEDRFFADARLELAVASNAHVTYSGRLNVVAQEGLGFPNRGNLTNDLRELYASFEPRSRSYLDAGRINVKSGVALGFNPTDFFKTRAVVDPLTADPSALREDRLGTLMVRAQHIGERSSIMVAYAPKVAQAASIAADPYRGFDPLWGRTNASQRWLVKASAQLGGGVNPEALLYQENGRWKAGVNVAESVGQSATVYLEASGGRRATLAGEAVAFGRATGTLPPAAPDLLDDGGEERFRSQVAAGASYTTESKVTFNLEYHYNGAGFSRTDWDRWFALGEGRPATSPIVRELWYLRAYAADQQEPLQRHSVFLRADWQDAFVPKLELSGFVLADAGNGSTLWQAQASYARTDLWSFGLLVSGTTGGRRANFGSLPRESSVLLEATRYF